MPRQGEGAIKRAGAEARYEKLRAQGLSDEQAERIAKHPVKKTARRGGKQTEYQGWSKSALDQRAKELEIPGRSKMNKQQLINAIRRLEALIRRDEGPEDDDT